MLCLVAPTTDVYRNLAIEEYLLKNRSEDFFLLWQSDNAVVVGKNQNIDVEVDMNYVIRNDIFIARRYSGGGAVYQDMGNFNLTFIENTDKVDFNRYINNVISFLASIGITAKTDERLGITVNGMKVSGSAQCIYKKRVMYHCTLLYATNLETLNASLNSKLERTTPLAGTKMVRAVKSVRSHVTNLYEHLEPKLSGTEFKELILNYFLQDMASNNKLYQLSPGDNVAIETLRERKYTRKEWISDRNVIGLASNF